MKRCAGLLAVLALAASTPASAGLFHRKGELPRPISGLGPQLPPKPAHNVTIRGQLGQGNWGAKWDQTLWPIQTRPAHNVLPSR
jgi:hypothetical protein